MRFGQFYKINRYPRPNIITSRITHITSHRAFLLLCQNYNIFPMAFWIAIKIVPRSNMRLSIAPSRWNYVRIFSRHSDFWFHLWDLAGATCDNPSNVLSQLCSRVETWTFRSRKRLAPTRWYDSDCKQLFWKRSSLFTFLLTSYEAGPVKRAFCQRARIWPSDVICMECNFWMFSLIQLG